MDAGCCPFLKHLEGNKKIVMYILFINFGVLNFCLFIIPQKNIERLYEKIQKLMI
jgi:hypothetical protein